MTKTQGKKLRNSMVKKYGSEEAWKAHMREIGSKGGKRSPHKSGFGDGEAGRERARRAGAVGGRISRRTKAS